jgi:HK97 family phage major capsid protein
MSKLIEKRASLVADMRNLLDGSEGLSADDQNKLAQIEEAFESCDKAIRAEEKLAKIEGGLQSIVEDSYTPSIEKENSEGDYLNAFNEYARKGLSALTGEKLAALQVGTDSEGGYIVPESFETKIVELLQSANPFRSISNVIRTASDRNIPVESSVGSFAYVAEEGAYGTSDPAFSRVVIGAHKSGGIIKVSEELLQDAFFNLETYLSNVAGRRFASLEETSFCTGNGTSAPQGVFTPTYTNNVTGAVSATAAITGNDLIDIFHSLGRAYRQNATWLMGDDAVKIVRKLVDSDGQYIWQPGLVAGAPDTIFGRPVIVSENATAPAADAKSVIFGDFQYYTIADRAGISAQKLNELYAANGQVGYKFNARNDAKVVLNNAFTSFTHGSAS